ncbi:MAG: CinA family protein [Varibaculum cambriense]
MNQELDTLARRLQEILREKSYTIACAESLTAGLVCATLCDIAELRRGCRGSHHLPDQYEKRSLGVSRPPTRNWSRRSSGGRSNGTGAAKLFSADVALATTGVAGPGSQDGHSAGKVFISVATPAGGATTELSLSGDRNQIRLQTVAAVLQLAIEALS